MENQALKLVTLFVRIDNRCKKKMADEPRKRGRPSKLFLSEIIAIYVGFTHPKMRNLPISMD
ncbi:MAG: hypothetical protein LBI69_03370 [Puniceicoccales bacterium]|nr:hypothetical protein [Puniceicoccales bacterium]